MKLLIYTFEEQNRQYILLIENQKQQRARLEDQRQFGGGSSMVIIRWKNSQKYKSFFKFCFSFSPAVQVKLNLMLI
jgi:hypothetical protein